MFLQLLQPAQISQTQSVVAVRGRTNWETFIPQCEQVAEFLSIQQFWLQLDIIS